MSRIIGLVGREAARHIGGMVAGVQKGAARAASHSWFDTLDGVRLAAVDVASSRFIAAQQGLGVVIDGAVVNRDELARGLGFDTARRGSINDAELIVQLYRRHGFVKLLELLIGEFSVALYDSSSATLWLARDRLGVRPLYYAKLGNGLAFASRPAALVNLPGVGTAINVRFAAVFAGAHYRYFDNVPEQSPYERVNQLPAAHWLQLRGDNVLLGRYWSLTDAPDFEEPQSVLAEQYRELLLSAVGMRFRSSQQPAFTLSGGMDSSSVLSSARHIEGAPQVAFSTVYSDKTFDESEEIRPMLEDRVSAWHPVRVDCPDVFSLVERMVAVNDEPVATATWLSHFVLCEQVANAGFNALFGGLGGDELNAGEYEYFFFHFADLARAGRTQELDAEIGHWARHHDHPIYRKDATVAAATVARCTDQSTPGVCRPDTARLQRYYKTVRPGFYDLSAFTPIMEAPFSSYLKTRSYQDLTRETAPCCLRAEDRQTQAFGLDNQVPFFDHRLIEFMFRVPGSLKISKGVTKILLRDAMRGILPEETRSRVKKTGWNAPAHIWFSGAGKSQLEDLVHSRSFIERGIYDAAEVQRLVREHDEIVRTGVARENHMMFFWQLVNLELWLRSLRG
jgi:asparagine synthase (glutamine-hydrolysing)